MRMLSRRVILKIEGEKEKENGRGGERERGRFTSPDIKQMLLLRRGGRVASTNPSH